MEAKIDGVCVGSTTGRGSGGYQSNPHRSRSPSAFRAASLSVLSELPILRASNSTRRAGNNTNRDVLVDNTLKTPGRA